MKNLCPVCGYPNLVEPPRSPRTGGGSYEICPSCGFEFGVTDDDLGFTYADWRSRWVADGMRWTSVGVQPPDNWDPISQLRVGATGGVAMPARSGIKVPLAEIPVLSTEIEPDVVAINDGGSLTLRFQFYREDELFSSGIVFRKVRAHQWRAESHTTPWHIEGAYDTIVEIEESPWVAELLKAEPAGTRGRWVIRHFMLYLDSAGCYEVAAESWELLPEEPAG
jgi:hypothetical protein